MPIWKLPYPIFEWDQTTHLCCNACVSKATRESTEPIAGIFRCFICQKFKYIGWLEKTIQFDKGYGQLASEGEILLHSQNDLPCIELQHKTGSIPTKCFGEVRR